MRQCSKRVDTQSHATQIFQKSQLHELVVQPTQCEYIEFSSNPGFASLVVHEEELRPWDHLLQLWAEFSFEP